MSITICAVILWLCFMSASDLPKVKVTNIDKIVHFVMFMGVSLVVYFENSRFFRNRTSFQSMFFASFLIPVIYSGGIEIAQEYLSSTRSGDWMDFLYDVLGALTGLIICIAINQRKR